jgi:hypothetical protein
VIRVLDLRGRVLFVHRPAAGLRPNALALGLGRPRRPRQTVAQGPLSNKRADRAGAQDSHVGVAPTHLSRGRPDKSPAFHPTTRAGASEGGCGKAGPTVEALCYN